ncbi:MAG: radical SAM protein [Deltaproteobacteria bacterium]|nr:MAG: radical SAM protein [Deltaproteobacteria bacterium]
MTWNDFSAARIAADFRTKVRYQMAHASLHENLRKLVLTYRAEGLKGVVAKMRLSNKEENEIECRSLPLVMRSKPILIYAEAVADCNMACTMCGRQFHEIRPEDEGYMRLEIFRKAAELIRPGTTLSLFGRGETLMHPDYPEMLRIAKEKGAVVGFNSNGKSLTPQLAEKMVVYGQDSLVISCSAGRPGTYNRIHYGGDFDQLVESVRVLQETKRRHGKPTPFLAFEFVAMRSNIEELPDLLRVADALDVRNILVIHVVAHDERMAREEQLRQPKFEKLTEEIFEVSRNLAGELGIELTLPSSYNPYTKKLAWSAEEVAYWKKILGDAGEAGPSVCLEAWQTFYVKFDGKVMPCVITNRPLGDLNEASAEEIWNGKLYQRYRERMRSRRKPPECQICHLMPGNTSYNPKLGDPALYAEEL